MAASGPSGFPSHMLSSPAFPGCGYQRPQDLLEAACPGVPEWTDEPEWALDCICSSPTARPSPVGTPLDPCRQRSCLRQVTLTVCPRRFVSMNSESTVPSCRPRKPIRADAVPKRSLNRSLGYGLEIKDSDQNLSGSYAPIARTSRGSPRADTVCSTADFPSLFLASEKVERVLFSSFESRHVVECLVFWKMPKYRYAQACGTRHMAAGPLFSTQFLTRLFRPLEMLLETTEDTADNGSYRDCPAEQASCLAGGGGMRFYSMLNFLRLQWSMRDKSC